MNISGRWNAQGGIVYLLKKTASRFRLGGRNLDFREAEAPHWSLAQASISETSDSRVQGGSGVPPLVLAKGRRKFVRERA
jgi:hypothetical protein